MSLRFPIGACAVVVFGMASADLSAQMPGTAPGGSPPLPPVPPASDVSVTNYSQRVTRKDGLRYIEEELSKALQFLSRKDSVDGLLAPPTQLAPAPVIVTPRNNKVEERDSWGMADGASGDRPGRPGDPLENRGNNRRPGNRSFDAVYDRYSGERALPGSKNDLLNPSRTRAKQQEQQSDPLSTSLREKQKALRESMGLEAKDRVYNPGGGQDSIFSGVFSHDERGLSHEEIKAHQDYLGRFREVLNASAPSASVLPDGLRTFATQPGALGGLDSYGSTLRRDNASAPANFNTAVRPASLPDLSAKALNQWNPLYEPPKYEPPKSLAPSTTPVMDTPRRRF